MTVTIWDDELEINSMIMGVNPKMLIREQEESGLYN